MRLLRDAFIALHAVGGLVGLSAGVVAILPSRGDRERRAAFIAFAVGVGFMIVFLAGALILDWPVLAATERVIFSALFVLALVMVYRARLAASRLRADPAGRDHSYIEHVGFNLISLFDGFVIVAAIDLGAPAWLVALIAIGAVLAGQRALASLERRARAGGIPRPAS